MDRPPPPGAEEEEEEETDAVAADEPGAVQTPVLSGSKRGHAELSQEEVAALAAEEGLGAERGAADGRAGPAAPPPAEEEKEAAEEEAFQTEHGVEFQAHIYQVEQKQAELLGQVDTLLEGA